MSSSRLHPTHKSSPCSSPHVRSSSILDFFIRINAPELNPSPVTVRMRDVRGFRHTKRGKHACQGRGHELEPNTSNQHPNAYNLCSQAVGSVIHHEHYQAKILMANNCARKRRWHGASADASGSNDGCTEKLVRFLFASYPGNDR